MTSGLSSSYIASEESFAVLDMDPYTDAAVRLCAPSSFKPCSIFPVTSGDLNRITIQSLSPLSQLSLGIIDVARLDGTSSSSFKEGM